MKYLLLLAALFAFSANAQQTNCQVYGNQIYCSTFGGGIRPSIQPNWNLGPQYQSPQQMEQMQAQANLARQQAELARQQAEQVQQQTEMLRQQQAELERQRAARAEEEAQLARNQAQKESPSEALLPTPRNDAADLLCPHFLSEEAWRSCHQERLKRGESK